MAPGLFEPARRELQGHRKSVAALAWSPSGRRLASGGADECVRTWSVEASASAKPERSELALMGQGGAVAAVEWHPRREDQLASLTEKHLKVWDTRAANKPAHSVPVAGGAALAWHPDGGVVAVASARQGSVSFVDVRKGAAVGAHAFGDEYPRCVKFLGNGSALLTGLASGAADVARVRPDFKGARSVAALHGHARACAAIAVDAECRHIATGGSDALVTIWDADAAVAVATVASIEYPVASVSLSADGRRVAFAQERGAVGVAAVPSGRVEAAIPVGASRAVAWNPKHAHILAYGSDDTNVWAADGRATMIGGAIGLAFFGSGGGGGGVGGGGGGGSGRR